MQMILVHPKSEANYLFPELCVSNIKLFSIAPINVIFFAISFKSNNYRESNTEKKLWANMYESKNEAKRFRAITFATQKLL